MSFSKRNHWIAVILFSFLFFIQPSFLHATEYYAFRLAGSDCTLCHTNPQNGSLNETGTLFQQRGYQYPLNWKGGLLYGLWVLPLFPRLVVFFRRYRLWLLGKVEGKWNRWKERWKGLVLYGLGHRTVLRSHFPGMSHLLLFWSFVVLGLTTLTIIVHEYLFLVFFTGFSVTGIRNHLYQSPFSSWAPIASTLSWVWGMVVREEIALKIIFTILWWAHLLLSFSLFSYVSFSRLLHLYSSPLNIFFRNLEPKGALSKIDLEASETYGVARIEEFTWKNLIELAACTRCGRCQETCPAHLSGKALNPKKVVQNLKHHLETIPRRKEGMEIINRG